MNGVHCQISDRSIDEVAYQIQSGAVVVRPEQFQTASGDR